MVPEAPVDPPHREAPEPDLDDLQEDSGRGKRGLLRLLTLGAVSCVALMCRRALLK